MKNLQLFETFSYSRDMDMMLKKLESKPEFSGCEFMIDETGKIPFLMWLNPADSREWRESGYAEDYDGDFSDVSPMPVLALTEIFGDPFAYMLTPEEKYNMTVMVDENIADQLKMITSLEDLEEAINTSLWGMD